MAPSVTNRRRMLAAVLTAPPIGAVIAFVFVVVLLDLAAELGSQGLARFFGDFMMLGSAVAYTVAAAVGIPAFMYSRRRRRLGLGAIVLLAASSGVIAFIPVMGGLTGSPRAILGTAALEAVSGAGAGAWFWLVAFGRRSTPARDQPV